MRSEFVSFKKLLEKKGVEFTVQKGLILEEIFWSDILLDANEIYRKLKYAGIGLATVNRTLKELKDLGIVREINSSEKYSYELVSYRRKPLHIHFQCSECGNIIDIDERNVMLDYLKLNKEIEDARNVDISDINIIFSGICSKCREERECQGQ